MTTIVRFEEIEAWQTAREITRLVYNLTRRGEFASFMQYLARQPKSIREEGIVYNV